MSDHLRRVRADATDPTQPLLPEQFKAAFRSYPSGVAVLTGDAGEGPVALTISSLFSISAEPALLGYSLSDFSSTAAVLNRAEHVVIHLMGGAQLPIAKLCASPAADRFADESAWARLDTGEPYYRDVDVWLRAKVIQRHKAGAATVTIAQVLSASPSVLADRTGEPLVYHGRAWHCLGRHSALS